MALLALSMAILLAMTRYSGAAYCVCNTGLSDSVLQKNIDYACGAGADCGQISQNGACFNPNTVRDHCNVAVNSYFQKKGQASDSCNFSGTATVTQTAPSGASSACYSGTASPSNSSSSRTNPTTAAPGMGTGINANQSFGGVGPSASTSGINDNSGDLNHHRTTFFTLLTLSLPAFFWYA